MNVDLNPRNGLPSESSKPSSEKAYLLAKTCIESLLRHDVCKKHRELKPLDRGFRVMIEHMCSGNFFNIKACYIGKGDVYSALVDLGFKLKGSLNDINYISEANFSYPKWCWDYFCNQELGTKKQRAIINNIEIELTAELAEIDARF